MSKFGLYRNLLLFSAAFLASISCALGQEIINVKVKVIADDDFRRQHPDWQEKIGTMVRDVSRRWEKDFGIRFVVKKSEPWQSDANLTDLDTLARQIIRGVDKQGADIIVGITAQQNVPLRPDARTMYPEAVILLREVRTTTYISNVLLPHEMGHVFGAVHVKDKNSIMHEKSRGGPYDSFNSLIIWKNRQRNFVLSSCLLDKKEREETVVAYYKAIEAKKTDGLDVYIMLGELQKFCNDCPGRIKALELAVKNFPNNATVHNDLGAAFGDCGNLEFARREFERALELDPNNKMAQGNLAKLERMGN